MISWVELEWIYGLSDLHKPDYPPILTSIRVSVECPQCPGELFVPMLLLRQGGCALTHHYTGEYSLSKTHSHKLNKNWEQIYSLDQCFPSTDALWDMSCSVIRVSGWHFLWPLTGLAGWDGYDRSWLCRQMGGRDPITTSQTLHNTWENVNKINRRVNKEIIENIKLSLNFEQYAVGLYFILILY